LAVPRISFPFSCNGANGQDTEIFLALCVLRREALDSKQRAWVAARND
jgi:uncharacterized protein YecT (DUF1311 family)